MRSISKWTLHNYSMGGVLLQSTQKSITKKCIDILTGFFHQFLCSWLNLNKLSIYNLVLSPKVPIEYWPLPLSFKMPYPCWSTKYTIQPKITWPIMYWIKNTKTFIIQVHWRRNSGGDRGQYLYTVHLQRLFQILTHARTTVRVTILIIGRIYSNSPVAILLIYNCWH